MKVIFVLIVCFLPITAFSQYQVVLNNGDTASVKSITKEGGFYTITKEDGQTSKVSTDLVRSVLKDYPNMGQEGAFVYCELVGTQKFLSPKVVVHVDYGQHRTLFDDYRLRDETGNVRTFNSMVDALNYMGSYGWEFVQAYTVTLHQSNVYHWLLKKEK